MAAPVRPVGNLLLFVRDKSRGSSQSTFALVQVERLHPAFSYIGEFLVERLKSGSVQRSTAVICDVVPVFQSVTPPLFTSR